MKTETCRIWANGPLNWQFFCNGDTKIEHFSGINELVRKKLAKLMQICWYKVKHVTIYHWANICSTLASSFSHVLKYCKIDDESWLTLDKFMK